MPLLKRVLGSVNIQVAPAPFPVQPTRKRHSPRKYLQSCIERRPGQDRAISAPALSRLPFTGVSTVQHPQHSWQGQRPAPNNPPPSSGPRTQHRTRGQNRMVCFVESEEASRFVRPTLSRRAKAKKRIDVAYANLQIEMYIAGIAIVRIWTNLRLQLAAGIIRRIKASNKGTVKADWP
jgi:hypothetical protein